MHRTCEYPRLTGLNPRTELSTKRTLAALSELLYGLVSSVVATSVRLVGISKLRNCPSNRVLVKSPSQSRNVVPSSFSVEFVYLRGYGGSANEPIAVEGSMVGRILGGTSSHRPSSDSTIENRKPLERGSRQHARSSRRITTLPCLVQARHTVLILPVP
ncbi:hypothetical protein V1477_015280 [Vespula maculifrons]|uniref:Uncharacterized protein n=1 Tax=Vespula maculifrons TaxID=7453 RepID=A0ABD2BJT6_VESMC